MWSLSARRAWIEIPSAALPPTDGLLSLSARRAWIEILPLVLILLRIGVALRKESVDRNLYYGDDLTFSDVVALRKESVDRNLNSTKRLVMSVGRSPQGERG